MPVEVEAEAGEDRARGREALSSTTFVAAVRWHRWLARFAIDTGRSRVGMIDVALREMAERHGYPPPPPRLGDGPDGGASRGGAMIYE